MSLPQARLFRRSVLLAGGTVLATGCLIACGTSGSTASPAPTDPAAATSAAGPSGSAGANGAAGRGGGQAFRPAAQGLIAEVDSGSMQVQSESAQTTVDWTSSTTFTQTKTAALSAVKTGLCIEAMAAPPTTGSGTGTGSSGTGSAAPEKVTALTAASVQLSQPVDGKCSVAAGFPAGGFGGERGGQNGAAGNPGAGNGGQSTRVPGRAQGSAPTGTAPTGGARPGAGGFAIVARVSGTVSRTPAESADRRPSNTLSTAQEPRTQRRANSLGGAPGSLTTLAASMKP